MAREHSMINTAIWNDADFRALPWPAQHLYFVLWTHPGLSYAGVVDWRPARIAPMAGGWSVEMVQAAADCLAARLFLVGKKVTAQCGDDAEHAEERRRHVSRRELLRLAIACQCQ